MHFSSIIACYAQDRNVQCTVLISMKIRPYLDAAEGIRTVFESNPNLEFEFHFLEEIEKSWKNDPSHWLKGTFRERAVIAVGHEALVFLISHPPDTSVHKWYTMVPSPSTLIPEGDQSFCGLYLSTNAEDQLGWIKNALPAIKSIGVLYDRRYNKEYVSLAAKTGRIVGVNLLPLSVRNKEDVPDVLRKNWHKIEGLLLIPDPTVISESLVKFIIKDGISNKVPVIGYNRFFVRSGALMAFVHDYNQIGTRTATMVLEQLISKKACVSESAKAKIIVNSSIAGHLGIDVSHALQQPFVEENE